MQRRTVPVYEVLAHDFKAMGIEATFGLMSDDTAMLVATLDSIGVKFHGARHENVGIAMAEGYAAATGRLGVAIIGRGPAMANGLNAATYALRSESPVLLVYGEGSNRIPAPNGLGPDGKAFNATQVLEAAGIRVMRPASAVAARSALADAAQSAWRHGATALLLPVDVQQAMIDPAADVPSRPRFQAPEQAVARPAAIRMATGVLAAARRPLIIAGIGAHRAGAREALIGLADHIGAALATTWKAKDMFRGHDFDCGIIGSFSHGAARRMFEQADCVLAFGASLNQRTTSFGAAFPADAPVIHPRFSISLRRVDGGLQI